MSQVFQVIATLALYGGLGYAFFWAFRFAYAFVQPLDRLIDENRVREFGIAGIAFGVVVATVIIWSLS
ncbi:hypothetical protein SEA_PLATTE_65 [Microbacterium phage Platte]|nr:hypothetical protein SEA_HORTUS1_65 [Microbacterium phage Hortus1]AWY05635.1 hypothetical protein SEA_OLINDD_65 [Microbacterium phage OlinDD]AWY05888.1 hypothetical protein SEA_PIONEER3_65 [Microbacterium phage Pioneer3]QZD97657.1 hypothetical protein SEA_PLATTE_65 [Microbacterium phage Platte]